TAAMIGVDLATDPAVRPALIEACDTGRLSATGLRAWRDAGEQRRGVAVIRAVFRERGGADDDAQTRRKMLLGFIAVAVSPDVIMEESLGQFRTDIDVLLYDELTPSGRGVMTAYDSKSRRCQSGPLPSQASRSPLAPILAQLDIPGGRWSIGCVATAEYVEERRSVLPLVSLAFGLVITAGTALYARTIIGQTEKVQALVDRRTAELQQANEQLAREVSDRNRAEIALGESERRFRALVETTSDWIWETDDCGVYTYVSPRIFDLLGFAPEEVIGREPFDFMEPWAVKWAREQFRSLAEARQPLVRLEDTFIAKDGRTVVVETNALPIIDEEGRFCGYRGVSRDVTDRKRTEDELAYERFLLTTLLENSPDYIYFKDAKSHFLRISRELSRRFLLSHPEEAEGKTDFDFFEFRRAEQAAADEQEVMRSGRPIVDKEEQQIWPNGEITWVSTT
ncbi:MAG: PAS domain S-box protein, partial [Thermoguttaceae bacterium]|nr:PAS domain S-box protein [Thermoguttaceae bacterium]